MGYNFNWSAVSGGAPYVTLSSLGIAFNSVSIAKLDNPEKILIGFDEAECVLGVKPYEYESGVKPYEFSERVKNGWIRIGCRDFIKYLQSITGIDFSVSKRYVAKHDTNENILIVFVRDVSEVENAETDENPLG
ncbi:MAG: hypothetical protein LBN30_01575 [Oscillospiraceae bacterium]|nr:hypothetical protein [Oscillospiraceae bacterium]